MKNRLLRIFCCLLFAAALPAAPLAAFAAPEAPPFDLYVSPDGDDAAPGTAEAPLKTPFGAQARLRELKGTVPAGEQVTVWFSAGVYEFNETLAFTADDLPDVTFAARPGEKVVFSGAKALSGFEADTVNGVAVFRKTLSAGEAAFGTLFNGEQQLSTPRYPKEGYFTVKDLCPEDDLWTEKDSPWDFTRGQRSFCADPADLGVEFSQYENAVVRILHWWHDELAYVTGLDKETGKISLSRPSSMLIRTVDRFYFENVFEALSAPGEWYLDKAQNVLYYVPFEGETPESLVLRASSLEQLVTVEGVSGLRFERIRFAETDWRVPTPGGDFGDWRADNDIDALQAALDVKGVISVSYAENIAFTNCEFINLGASGVKLMNGVKHSRIENCYFDNIAATAVFAGGANCKPDEPDYTSDITVKNNEIYRYGRRFFCAIGVHITYCDTAEVVNNEIHDGYYTGISCGWVWGYSYHATKNVSISRNLIYDIGQGWLSDMGGIYMLGVQPGTVLSENVIHNVAADPGEGGYGGWGIYLDEGSSLMTVEKNLVFCCGSQGFNIHYGEGNVIRNNISALSAEGQVSVGTRSGEDHATAFYYNNIFVSDGRIPFYIHMHDTAHFYDNGNLFYNVSAPGEIDFSVDGGSGVISLADAERRGFIHNATVTDPGFADLNAFDFTLREDSPAYKLNFAPWDYSAAGTVAGTEIGLSREGGRTPYAGNARLNPAGEFKKSGEVKNWFLWIAGGLAAAGLAVLAVPALKKIPARLVPALLVIPFCALAAAATYRFFVNWAPVPYLLASVAMYAAAALLPLAAPGTPRKRAFIRYLIRLAAVLGGFYGLTLLLNNVLRVGEPIAIGAVLMCLGAYLLAAAVITLRRFKKSTETLSTI